MGEIKVLTLVDSAEWNQLLSKCRQPDIHFTPEYLKIFQEHMGGTATLFVEKLGAEFLLYPFFKRKINELDSFRDLDEIYFDVTSPWYFGGPLLSSSANRLSLFKAFLSDFHSYAKENSIVSEFSRLYPIMQDDNNALASVATAKHRYDVTFVDLSQSLDAITGDLKKSNRNAIAAAQRKGVEIDIRGGWQALEQFYSLYNKSMSRLQSSEFYRFDLPFLNKMLRVFGKRMTVIVAKYGGIPAAASIFLSQYGVMHYWLSGFDPEYRAYYPNNLLLYKAIELAREQHNRFFLLMGGSSPSLRTFKESFSKSRLKFHTYEKIHDESVYAMLSGIRNKKAQASDAFFPAYRRP